METPFFSILIPCFKAKQIIEKSLQSCFNQKFTDYEIIVCDNGSQDGIEQELNKYNQIKYFLGKKQVSTIELRNFLIKQANGKYIVWLEPGDELSSNFLQEGHSILTLKHFDIVEMKTKWKTNDAFQEINTIEEQDYFNSNCLNFYLERDDIYQDVLWGKIISTEIMKQCVIDDFDVYAAEEVLYSAFLYRIACSYKKINSDSYYIYDCKSDHFHGLSQLNLENIKYMCKIRYEQFKRMINLLDDFNIENYCLCIKKIYLENILNDIMSLENLEDRKQALIIFQEYFDINLSVNMEKIKENNYESNR